MNMIDYVKGKIVELSPMSVVIDNNGIGYSMLISLQTYQALEGKADGIVYIHHHIRCFLHFQQKKFVRQFFPMT